MRSGRSVQIMQWQGRILSLQALSIQPYLQGACGRLTA